MGKLDNSKNKIRLEIKNKKKSYSSDILKVKSEEILTNVELLGIFQQAQNILCYNSLDTEVQTLPFMNKWIDKKNFYLPVIDENEIVFRNYTKHTKFKRSSFGVLEPIGDNIKSFDNIDLIIIPGVAFDKKKNRIGYGKGFYDRFLSNKLNIPKLGICFEFQLISSLPVDDFDVPMDYLVSENEIIW